MKTNNPILKQLIKNINLRNKGLIPKENYAEDLIERINPPKIIMDFGGLK